MYHNRILVAGCCVYLMSYFTRTVNDLHHYTAKVKASLRGFGCFLNTVCCIAQLCKLNFNIARWDVTVVGCFMHIFYNYIFYMLCFI